MSSSKEARKFVSEEEMELYRQTFQLFDFNGDGEIDAKELETVMKSLGMAVTENELKCLMAEMDQNRTGTISFENFVQLISTPTTKKLATNERSNFEAKSIPSRRKTVATSSGVTYPSSPTKRFSNSLFSALGLKQNKNSEQLFPPCTTRGRRNTATPVSSCANHSSTKVGDLSPAQSSPKRNMHLGLSFASVFNKNTKFEKCVFDSKGKMERTETEYDMSHEEEMRQVFKVFDINGDGFVSVNEMRQIMNKLGLGIIMKEEEVRGLFSLVDSDSDGCITFVEFCALFSMS
jgi:Ca2+-binding EF-hand superfamily protein